MPLPTKTLRVLPNPWTLIHPELGPHGVCHVDTAGRGGIVRFVGAEIDRERTRITEARDEGDPRHSRQVTVFRFYALDDSLVKPAKDFEKGIEVAKTAYYFDRLRDGDLVPADTATAAAGPCRFKDLAAAKDEAVKDFELHYGPKSFDEVEKRAKDAVRALEQMKKAAETKAEKPKADADAGAQPSGGSK